MKRSEIEIGSIYRGAGPSGRVHRRRVDSIDERAGFTSDAHVVTYSRLYNGGWAGGFNCTLGHFAGWAHEKASGPVQPVAGRRYKDDACRQIRVVEPVADNSSTVLIEVEDYRGNPRRITWSMGRWRSSIVEELP